MKKHPRGMKRTFVVLLFLLTCAIAYVVVSAAVGQVKRSVEEQYADSGKSLARVYAMVFTNMITQSQDSLRVYAEGAKHDLLPRRVSNADASADSNDGGHSAVTDKEIVDYIVQQRSRSPGVFSYMFFANPKGQMWNDSGVTADISDRPYFKAIIEQDKLESIGTAVVSRTSGQSVVHLARAFKDDDKNCYGLIGAVIPVGRIQSLFSSAVPSATLESFVSDSSMKCTLHPKFELDPNSGYDDEDVKVYTSPKHSSGGTARFYIKKIPNAAWYVGVRVSEEQLYGTYNRLNRAKGIVFAVMILAGLLLYAVSMLSLMRLNTLRREAVENDPVTELLSEAPFERRVQAALDGTESGEFVLMEMDITGFKFINKSYGVEAGNEVLRQFSAIANEHLIRYGGFMARGYADHFYYFTKLETDRDLFFGQLVLAIGDISQMTQATPHQPTPKYGISFVTKESDAPCDHKSALQLIGEASTARKIAKHQTDKDFCVYSTKIEQRILKEQKIERNMKKALAQGEFYVVYQPKVSLETEKVIGAEALVRWDSPEMGPLPPDDFVPIFERNGFVRQVDFAVYEMVFRFIRRMLDAGHNVVPISLNMSRMHNDPDVFIRKFMRLVKKYDIPANLVEIEILERAVADEKPVLKEITSSLKSLGFSIAMDDFGSGESNLNMLSTIDVDTLKFDQNFLRGQKDSDSLRTFITSLVQMAQKLQRKTVFEGVETKEQRDFLKSINCDVVQGYFYSRPLKEDDFVSFLEQHM